jgi:predicted RNase H-like HicB family nuclease
MRPYIALIHKDPSSDYGVSFPDLPGCVTAGATLDQARVLAAEALAYHISGLVEDGDAVPEASSLEVIMSDADNRDGVAVLIDAPLSSGRHTQVNVTLPDDLLEKVDRYAEVEGLTRSGFLTRAARHELDAAGQ